MTRDLKTFDRLDSRELYAGLALRNRVFVVEQNCVYHDIDGEADFSAMHLMYWHEGRLAPMRASCRRRRAAAPPSAGWWWMPPAAAGVWHAR